MKSLTVGMPDDAAVKPRLTPAENPKRRLPLRSASVLPLALVLTLAVSGCGTVLEAPAPAAAPSERLLSVKLAPEETAVSMESRYGGRIVFFEPGDVAALAVEAGHGPRGSTLALLGSDGSEPNAEVRSGQASPVEGAGMSMMWAGGMSMMWAGGMSMMWAGGMSMMWAGGEYSWMPENTAAWHQIGLWEGHSLAPNLGYGVKVAVIDTGVDLTHPALVEALAPAEELWDFRDGDGLPQEEGSLGDVGYGHGSNVAGIIRQVAPRATILPLRVLGPDGVGEAADVAAAIHWATVHGADVINLSLGAAQPVEAVKEAIRIATGRGVLVVMSAGDGGDKQVTYPASKSDVSHGRELQLSVTSVDPADAKTVTANYSQTKVELAAPGSDLYGPLPGERKAAWSGTSTSAAVATGALALALAEDPATPRSSLIRELRETADDIYSNGMNEEYQGQLGSGRMNVGRFIARTTSGLLEETR